MDDPVPRDHAGIVAKIEEQSADCCRADLLQVIHEVPRGGGQRGTKRAVHKHEVRLFGLVGHGKDLACIL